MHLPQLILHSTASILLCTALVVVSVAASNAEDVVLSATELPKPFAVYRQPRSEVINDAEFEESLRGQRSRRPTLMDIALQASARAGLDAMTELYDKIEPNIVRNGQLLDDNHPAALLSKFSAPVDDSERREMAAFATISATKAFRKNYKYINELARQAHSQKISLRRTALEGLCPPRDPPPCMPASERYRTHDGTCNNKRRLRWGGAHMPFNRFLPPEYGDGVDTIRNSVEGGPLSSSRFVSLLVHGAKDGEAPLTLMTAQWGQLLDHDMTSTAQPRSINGSVPSCCGGKDFHPSCFPIKVPLDDPWLSPLKVRCLEFLRSAPAQRRDCVLSWREQTNQATSYIDASPIYSSSAKSSDNARVFRNGLLVFGRGNPADDVCQRGAIATQCIRSGDGRSGEQPGLLALHHVWVGEHNRIAMELSEMNSHWSDEKLYQETRRIIGAMFQHITYREFLPIILGREVCKLFDLDLLNSGYYEGYDTKTNPTVANSFAAAAFRFGHSLVQNSYMRCDRHHNVINNNVSLHEEFQRGDIGSAGSLHRLLRGLATQRALKRDEFITPELTNHLFQTPGFPFGLDLAAINIQRGRDHGIAPYTSWRIPCGLTPINNWNDFENVVGPESAKRIGHAYRSVHDIDLFVGGIAERPVVGGLVGPTFACIIAQQFSNSRKGDRFWYENIGFESSFTPAQLHSMRRVSLAQVMCRAVGGGTFQPHIFIPSEFPGNERLPCGAGPLTPIDLNPWLEQDPFGTPTFDTQTPERVFDILPTDINTNTQTHVQINKEDKAGFSNRVKPVRNTSLPLTHVPQISFIPNASTGFQRPQNTTKINDKLDIRQKKPNSNKSTRKPITGVHNKLDKGTRVTLHIKGTNARRTQKPTRRTVVVNNIPIELRGAIADLTTDTTNSTDTKKPAMDSTTRLTTKAKRKNTSTKTDKLSRADDIAPNDDSTIAESDIFDIFTTLTETETNSSTHPTHTNGTELKLTTSEDVQTRNEPSQLKVDQTTDFVNEQKTNDNISEDRLANTTLFNKPATIIAKFEDKISVDIDPLTHSHSTSEHKRVQRKLYGTNDASTQTTTKANSDSNIAAKDKSFAANIPKFINNTLTKHTLFQTLKNRTATTKLPKHSKTTPRNVELRQYQTRPIYTRPQKVIVDGPNADQYEIEINIRQTNKSPPSRPIPNYSDYTTIYKPYAYDRYTSNYGDYSTTTPAPYGYYQPPPTISSSFAQVQRTKPPTVIYLNEHDERTTTRQPGLLQNFITFATSGLGGNRRPSPESSNAQKEKPHYLPESSILGGHASSPHSSNNVASSSYYVPRPQTQSQLPSSSSSFSQVGGVYPPAGSVHASSGAVSSGSFGSIAGFASANGADSTFSFNIRPRPENNHNQAGFSQSETGTYGLLPPRKPSYGALTSPEYTNLPVATPQNYYEIPHRESDNSPFSITHKRPQSQTYYSRTQTAPQQKDATYNDLPTPPDHKLEIYDYDYLGRTLEPTSNFTSAEEDDKDDYVYNDDDEDDENIAAGKKFDRDGYLRPEHMAGNLFNTKDTTATNRTNENSTFLDDNYVLPALNGTQSNFMNEPTESELMTVYRNLTVFTDAQGKHFNNDILAEDYEDDSTEPFIVSKTAALTAMTEPRRQAPVSNVAFAPINILTKPERPDNWVIFDTLKERPLLPELPVISVGDSLPTAEVPMPIKDLSNIWLARYTDRDSTETQHGTGPNVEELTSNATDTDNDKRLTNFTILATPEVTTERTLTKITTTVSSLTTDSYNTTTGRENFFEIISNVNRTRTL